MTVELIDTNEEGATTVPVQQLGNERTIAYTDGPDLVMERIFDAPRELVWKVLHDNDRIPHWWGPRTTKMIDVPPFNLGEPAIETMTLEDLGTRTRLVSRSRFPSVEVLDGALSTGMIGGALESYDRLAEEIAKG